MYKLQPGGPNSQYLQFQQYFFQKIISWAITKQHIVFPNIILNTTLTKITRWSEHYTKYYTPQFYSTLLEWALKHSGLVWHGAYLGTKRHINIT